MARFRVLGGTHHHDDGKIYGPDQEAGEIVESDKPLDRMFANKFRRLGGPTRLSKDQQAEEKNPKSVNKGGRVMDKPGTVEKQKRGKDATMKAGPGQEEEEFIDLSPERLKTKDKGSKKKRMKTPAELDEEGIEDEEVDETEEPEPTSEDPDPDTGELDDEEAADDEADEALAEEEMSDEEETPEEEPEPEEVDEVEEEPKPKKKKSKEGKLKKKPKK